MKHCGFLIAILLIPLLQVGAMAAELPADGQYTVAVTLSGGSGRAGVEPLAAITVADNAATAIVTWSSPYYEYMLMDGVYYYPVNTNGNSTFEIPVSLDEDMAVSAQTNAMSVPHQIDYTLFFDSATLKPLSQKGAVSLALVIPVTAVAALVIVTGLRRRARKQKATGG